VPWIYTPHPLPVPYSLWCVPTSTKRLSVAKVFITDVRVKVLAWWLEGWGEGNTEVHWRGSIEGIFVRGFCIGNRKRRSRSWWEKTDGFGGKKPKMFERMYKNVRKFNIRHVAFKGFIWVNIHIPVLRNVTLRCVVEWDRRFAGTCCSHVQGWWL